MMLEERAQHIYWPKNDKENKPMSRLSGGSWTAVWSAKRHRIMCSWKRDGQGAGEIKLSSRRKITDQTNQSSQRTWANTHRQAGMREFIPPICSSIFSLHLLIPLRSVESGFEPISTCISPQKGKRSEQIVRFYIDMQTKRALMFWFIAVIQA